MMQKTLLEAARAGDRHAVASLLESGATPDERGGGGETALILAAAKGATDVIEMLIARGADVNAATTVGNTALMMAAARGHVPAVRVLVASGARVAHKNKYGLGAADWAKWTDRRDAILALLGPG
jgi:ankyrin repeat protein